MTVFQLLDVLDKHGIEVSLDGPKLRTNAPKGAITGDIADAIRRNKDALVELLQRRAQQRGQQQAVQRIGRAPARRLQPLSFAQQRLWFIDQFEGATPQYNIGASFELRGRLNREALQQALDAILARHDVLRTVYVEHDGAGWQQVQPAGALPVRYLDRSQLDAAAQDEALRELVTAEARTPFDLTADLMLRVSVVTLALQRHVLMVSMHHIASDGWSIGVLVNEFASLYAAFDAGRATTLAPLPVQYVDFAHWQREQLQGARLDEQARYWSQQLAGIPQVHNLPLDHPRPALQSFAGRRHRHVLPAALAQRLRTIAQGHDATLFMLLHAAFAVLFARWSNQDDVVVGTPSAGRLHRDVEPLIGFFINTLILRSQIEPGMTFVQLLAQSRRTTLDAFSHQDIPFETLVERLQPARSLSHAPLFQVLFALQTNEQSALELPDLQIRRIERDALVSKFDIELSLGESEDGLHVTWQYAQALFQSATIERMAESFGQLLDAIARDPEREIDAYEVLPAADAAQLAAFSRSQDLPLRDVRLHEGFEQQADRIGDALAVECEGESLSYAQLDAQANQVAHYLIAHGVKRGDVVGICVERSARMLVGLLGILKAGAAYAPLDPAYPSLRLSQMREDSDASVILSQAAVMHCLPAGEAAIVLLEPQTFAAYPRTRPHIAVDGEDLAYLIFTSGSTGRPKAVEIRHRNVAARIAWAEQAYTPAVLRRVLASTSLNFDLSVFELFVPLSLGHTVVVVKDALALLERPVDVTLINTVPSAIKVLLDNAAVPTSVREVNLAGEPLPGETVNRLLAETSCEVVHNLYGPSEDTTYSTGAVFRAAVARPPGIGKPLPNTRAYVLSAQGQPVPVGVIGELYLGGAGVTRGYRHREELTAERYLPDPFADEANARMYRTGDQVRWRTDGELDYLGRADDQVKVRGFRIELGEIEWQLRRQPGVREAVVVARGIPGEQRVVAYLVGEQRDDDALRQGLQAVLPDYMVPAGFVHLDALPLTPNGKVDKRNLPEPDWQESQQRVAAETPTEALLAQIWSGILNLDAVSVTANFFALGGHSLLATRVASAIQAQWHRKVGVRAVFEHPSVRALAAHIDTLAADAAPAIRPVPRDGLLPLSYAQQRLWFIDQFDGESHQYNMPGALRLRGQLDEAALQAALDGVVARHEILRTTYAQHDGAAIQRIAPAQRVPVTHIDLSTLSETAQSAELERLRRAEALAPFDLRCDLMLRVTRVQLSADDSALLFTLHHIAADGWSLGVLVRELMTLYAAHQDGVASTLPALDIQYADYAHWQRETLQGEVLDQQLGYWQQQLAGLPAVHNLPLDRPRPAQQRFHGAVHTQQIDRERLKQLRDLAQSQGATLFMLLESAFALLIGRWSGEDDIVIGTPIAGRTHPAVEPLIGFFINTLVLRTQLPAEASFTQLLAQTRQTALQAYAHQDVPFEMLVDRLHPARSLSHTPLFQILFTLQNNARVKLELPQIRFDSMATPPSVAKFDLDVTANETEQGLQLSWLYATALFDADTVERLAQSFGVLLASIVRAPATPLAALPLLPALDAEKMDRWNSTELTYPAQICLHELVEAHALEQPSAIALVHGSESLSYAELDGRANRIANHLLACGVTAQQCIGICAERGFDMFVAVLGVLKAGAAYVPLDPSYPRVRLEQILEDSGVALVLLQTHLIDTLPASTATLLPLDDVQLASASPAKPTLAAAVEPDHLAYVIFTSGSTGRPKGVMVEHGAIVAKYFAWEKLYGLKETVRSHLQMASFGFDVCVGDWVRALCSGARLVLCPKDTLVQPASLLALIDDNDVHCAEFVPAVLRSLVDHLETAGRILPAMRCVVVGSDLWTVLDQRRTRAVIAASARLINSYGVTEASVDSSCYEPGADLDGLSSIPIGAPLANTRLHVLNAQGQTLPIGVVGELHIGGIGLARGYLGRPELDAERFFVAQATQERLYRSGDLARWRRDGNLELVGRGDDQVKLRGFRIELGEIETALMRQPSVRKAVVVAQGEAQTRQLVAYVIASADIADTAAWFDTLRAELKRALPDYMVPALFMALDTLPLTPNGKVDKKALPLPDLDAQLRDRYCAPRNATEAQLCAIWAQLLRLETVGIHDNFFAIGGDSILSIQAVARAGQAGIAITTRQLFEAQTVAELAPLALTQAAVQQPQTPVEGRLELLPIQRTFLARDAVDRHHDNQAVLLQLANGSDAHRARPLLAALYARHDALRLRFVEWPDGWHASHAPLDEAMLAASIAVDVLPEISSDEDISARCSHWQATLDLARGPLLRAVLLQRGSQRFLLLALHHLIVDGVSWRVLLADLQQAQAQQQAGEPIVLGAKTSSLQRWGAALAGYADSDMLRAEKDYWLAQARIAVPPLPRDNATQAACAPTVSSSDSITLRWSAEETQALLRDCSAAYRTQINELLLAAVYLGLRDWCGAPAYRIHLEGHGREDLFAGIDLSQTVGWFTSLYPLVLRSDSADTAQVIKAIKEQHRAIPARGIGHGVLREIAHDRQLLAAEAGHEAALVFNYLGQFDQVLEAGQGLGKAGMSAGASVSPRRPREHTLELNGLVAGGCLSFSLGYSRDDYARETIERLGAAIEAALRNVIAQCRTPGDHALTPSDFPLARVDSMQLDAWQQRYPRLSRLYPATPMQAGMFFHSRLDASAYVTQTAPFLVGELQSAAFRAAWEAVLARHDILRTVFVGEDATLHQLVQDGVTLPWQEHDWRDFDAQAQEQRFESLRLQELARGFALDEAPLLRLHLVALAPQRHRLLWTHHHMLLDGWCMPLLYREVMQHYQAALLGRRAELPAPPPFERYMAWLARQDENTARRYWQSRLGEIESATVLPGSAPDAATTARGRREQHISLDAAQTAQLQAWARRRQTTVNTVLQTVWAYLLHSYSGDDAVVFGATVAGRPAQVDGVDEMVGLFINTLPVIVDFADTPRLGDLLRRVQQDFQRSQEFGYLPLNQIQRESRVPSGTALFDSLFVFENYPMDAAVQAASAVGALQLEGRDAGEETNYALTLTASLVSQLRLRLGYRAERHDDASIERLLAQFGRVLTTLQADDAARIHDISPLADEERTQLLAWGGSDAVSDDYSTLAQRFEEQVRRAPDAIAVRSAGAVLSYAALNARANRIAHLLRSLGVGDGDAVGLCLPRGIDAIVALLGIVKAGAAYLPLDPDYPAERLQYMLADSGVSRVLAGQGTVLPADVLALDAADVIALLAQQPDTNPPIAAGRSGRSLAYLMYTSGSTGQPKGTLIEQRSVLRLVDAPNFMALDATTRFLQLSSISFDAATLEIWAPLLNGGELVIHAPGPLDLAELNALIVDTGITSLWLTAGLFEQWSHAVPDAPALRQVLAGGDVVNPDAVRRVYAQLPGVTVINGYGPTENTTFTCCHAIPRDLPAGRSIALGSPVSATAVRVVSPQRRLVPLGGLGELVTTGAGLARGYLNRPDLTADRFVQGVEGSTQTWYRTGDLVRYRADGTLEFAGRIDNQCKIRGYRVEPGEIEAVLRQLGSVRDAVVIAAGEAGAKRLVAYVVAATDMALPAGWPQNLREALAGLPDYLVPSAFVALPALPLTPNGKVDKRALPEVDLAGLLTERHVAPRTPVENTLCAIWAQLLRLPQVGIEDNFFAIGGDSILSIQAVARANQAGIAITTRQLFETPTVAALAALAQSAEARTLAPQDAVTGALELLPIQQLFLSEDDTDRHHFNQSLLLRVPVDFDADLLAPVLHALVERHDALRLSFRRGDSGWSAQHDAVSIADIAACVVRETLPAEDFAASLRQRGTHWQASLDLARGPLLRAVLFDGSSPSGSAVERRLLLVIHHLVVDAVSWRILLADLETAYGQARSGTTIALAPKTSSLQQWSAALVTQARSDELRGERDYWLAQARLPVAALQTDHAVARASVATTATLSLKLSPASTEALLRRCGQAYRTQINELLLAGVYLGLRAWSGHDSLRLALEGHGREDLFDTLDLSQTVGWFTTLYPLVLHSADGDCKHVIKAVKEQYRAIPRRGIGHGQLCHMAGDALLLAAQAQSPAALVFNYLGQLDASSGAVGAFALADENAGPALSLAHPRRHLLGLNGQISHGVLSFTLDYSSVQFDPARMQSLLGAIESGLEAIIAHCQQPDAGAYTPSDFPLARVSAEQLDRWQASHAPLARLYPATPMQQGMLFHSRIDRSAYVSQTTPVISGALQPVLFKRAWEAVVARHDILRTAFVGEEGLLHQLVQAQVTLPWQELDWSGLTETEQHERFEQLCDTDRALGFDPAQAPLLRLHLVRLAAQRHRLLWTHHHMLLDGWCMPLVYREVMQHYYALAEGQSLELPAAPLFQDYLAWLAGRDAGAALAYWRERLQSVAAPTRLSSPQLSAAAGEFHEHSLSLTTQQTDQLQAWARQRQLTVNSVVQAAWAWLLHGYSGEETVVFGATVSGRPAEVARVEDMVGLFINTIPVVVQIDTADTALNLLRRVQQDFQRSQDFAFLPLNQVQRESRLGAGTALFDSLLVFENYPTDVGTLAASAANSLRLEMPGMAERTNYALTLTATLTTQLRLDASHLGDVIDPAMVQRLLAQLCQAISAFTADDAAPLHAISVLGEDERAQLLEWGGSDVVADDYSTLAHCFEAQVLRSPAAAAVRCAGASQSYAELNARANRLAHLLGSYGVGEGDVIGLCLPRGIDAIVALLGIVKAGAAYLPLDPDYPAERLQYMLADSGVSRVLAGQHTVLPVDVLALDAADVIALLAQQPDTNPPIAAGRSGRSLAYLMYTSGSTGQPKGTLIEQRSVLRLVDAPNFMALDATTRFLQLSSISFDAATLEIWAPLLNGGELVIHAPGPLDLAELNALIIDTGITSLWLTAGLFEQWSHAVPDAPALRQVLAGGDVVNPDAVRRVYAQLPGVTVINGYGPTENTTFTCCHAIPRDLPAGRSIALGSPVSATAVRVVSPQRRLVPLGGLGELVTTGAGLARGYLNRPDLTADRFVQDVEGSTQTWYRTGDLVRYRVDGTLEFAGRIDNQCKIRGYRVEPGEIEAALRELPQVRDAVVIAAGEAGAKRLVAYVAAVEDAVLAPDWPQNLRDALSGRLPEYLLPSAFVALPALPLTPNGKVDKRALPQVDLTGLLAERHVAPRTPIETALCEIWAELLHLPQVGIEDNFFAIGGDSILSIQAVARANQAGIAITTRQLFEMQTIARLAALAVTLPARTYSQASVSGEQDLLPLQRQFLQHDRVDQHHFNQTLLLDAPGDFDASEARTMLAALIRRHDALRLRFVERADGWKAEYADFDDAMVEACLVREQVPAENADAFVSTQCAYWQRSLDLARGPLLRAVVFEGGETVRLLLVVHHLVVDGVSWRVLLADLENARAQLSSGQAVALAPKTSSLQDWGRKLREYSQSAELHRERDYWLQQARLPVASLPQDFETDGMPALASSGSVAIRLGASETDALLRRCAATYRTQINELLLAGVYLGFRQWSGNLRLLVALESHGREEIDAALDLSQTVGWFTTLHPLVLDATGNDVGATIKAVKERIRAIPGHGLGYGVLRDLAGDTELLQAEAGSRAPLLFNYLGQFDQALQASGPFAASRLGIGSSVSERRAREYLFELNGQVSGGVLNFSLDYSREQYRPESVQRLAQSIEAGLRAVIAHCQAPQQATLTPSDFALAQVSAAQLDVWQSDYAISRLYPAAPMQTGMLFHSRLDPTAYVMHASPVLEGPLDARHFRAAWNALVARHDIFRTVFVAEDAQLHQLVVRDAAPEWDERDWRSLDVAQQAQQFADLRLADHLRGFDFAAAPLMRLTLLRLAESRYQLLWTYHHLLLDGWCIPLIYREVLQNYQALREGRAVLTAAAPVYQDFLAWIQRQDVDNARSYWNGRLADIESPTPLMVDQLGGQQGHGPRMRSVVLDAAQTRRLQEWTRRQRGTVNSAVQLAWAYLLRRYSGEDSVVFGATFAGRPAGVDGIEEMLGLFINSLPVRVDFAAPASAGEMLRQVQQDFQRSQDYGFLPLAEIQQQSRVPGGTPLFHSLLVFENYPVEAALKTSTGDLRIVDDSEEADDLVSAYTLNIAALLTSELTLHCGYAAEKLADATVERLLEQLAAVLNALPDSAEDAPLHADIAAADRGLLEAWNATGETFPEADGIVRIQALFEQQVALRPDAIALVDATTCLSYAELDAAANRVAHWLLRHGVERGQIVAICIDRSVQVLVGLLGVLKAGAAYVPLDPAYPAERLRYMLDDSGARQVLSVSAVTATLDFDGRAVLCLDDTAALADCATTTPDLLGAHIDDVACLIYTSGSTGRPKGVMLVHRGPINMAFNQRRLFALDSACRVLQFASISFDALTWDWAMALCNGGALHLLDDERRHTPQRLAEYLVEHAITHATLPPAVLPQMDETLPYALRMLIVAGEACEPGLAWRWAARVPLYNGYGPTENTVCASIAPVRIGQRLRLGVPIRNVRLEVLDARGDLQPIGVPGELHISGESLARGYWNRDDLTAAAFVADPRDATRRVYRSGDIVRWLPEGELEYLGRADHQVKIRGFRVELGEIEAQLARGHGVREAVVVAQTASDGAKLLVAYVTGDGTDTAALRAQLAQDLPEHMLPAAILHLDELPLTPNGKLDRRALPLVDSAALHAYVAPETPTEERLAELWCRLLRLPQVSVEASFFEVGGHSLLVTRMAAEFRRDLPFEIPLAEIFKHKTIRSLARQIDLLAAEQSLRNDIAFDAPTSSDSDNGLIEL